MEKKQQIKVGSGVFRGPLPCVNGKMHGIAIPYGTYIDVWHSGRITLEIQLSINRHLPPKQKPIFNKTQFKQLCSQQ